MENELVSVIIPTWNREKTLLRSVESALNQSYKNVEVLVCDDGSTDKSKEIIGGLKDFRVKWLGGFHSGLPSVPRNRGLEIAKGKWIAFLDSDDWWVDNKLEKQLRLMKQYGSDMSSTNATRIIGSGTKKNKYIRNNNFIRFINFVELFSVNPLITSSVLVKSTLLKNLRFNESKEIIAVEDYLLWLTLSLKSRILYIPEELVFYNDNGVDSVRKKGLTWIEQKKEIEKNLLTWSLSKNMIVFIKVQLLIVISKIKYFIGGKY